MRIKTITEASLEPRVERLAAIVGDLVLDVLRLAPFDPALCDHPRQGW